MSPITPRSSSTTGSGIATESGSARPSPNQQFNQVVSKRMVKKQQMQWTPEGAHLLLQVRTQVLNDEWEDTFRTWYPSFRPVQTVVPAARAA